MKKWYTYHFKKYISCLINIQYRKQTNETDYQWSSYAWDEQENQYAFSFKVLEYLSEVAISQSITSDEPFNSWLIEKHLMKSVS